MDESGAYIDPFPTPHFFSLEGSSGTSLEMAHLYPVIFALVFTIWLAYTLVATYHWLRYGHRSFMTVPMLAMHLVVSSFLFLITTAGLR